MAKRDQADQSLIDEINSNFLEADTEWREVRDEGATDMRYISGQPWTDNDLAEREGRPSLSLDELNQYTNSVTNNQRQNKRAIEVTAAGDGATDQTARFFADKVREVEYRSHAQDAYSCAFGNAVERSYGFAQLMLKPIAPDSFDQDVWIEPILNPDLVTPDPSAIRTTFSDQKFCYVHEMWDQKEFTRTFKDAEIVDFDSEMRVSHSAWIHGDKIRLANYWKVKTTRRKLLLVEPKSPPKPRGSVLGLTAPNMAPFPVFADEITKEQLAKVIVKRESWREEEAVCKYLTNGVEVLETVEWPGKYIPVVACLGKIIYVNEGGISKRRILSLPRLARDAYKLLCYYASTEAEMVGIWPRAPYMAYEGQLSPEQMLAIVKATKQPVPVVLVKPSIEDLPGLNGPLPFPIRQPFEPNIQMFEIGKESARRSIQSAMAVNALPSAAQRRNDKSGVALQKIDESAARGSFHFNDHYYDFLRQCGIVAVDLIRASHDAMREAAVMTPDDKPYSIPVNSPNKPRNIDPSQGEHIVTISDGPSVDSEHEAVATFTDALITTPQLAEIIGPQKMPRILALAVKMKNLGPLGDAIAAIIDPSAADQADPKQQLQQLIGEHQKLVQVAQQMKQALDTEQAKQAAQIKIAQLNNDSKERLQKEELATKLAVARMTAGKAAYDAALEAQEERIALDTEQAHEVAINSADAAHEAAMSDADRQHATQLATMQADAAQNQPQPGASA